MYTNANSVQVDYSTFRDWVEQGKVEYVHMSSTRYTITLKEGVKVDLGQESQQSNLLTIFGQQGIEAEYYTPVIPEYDPYLILLLEEMGVGYGSDEAQGVSFLDILLSFLPMIIMLAVTFFLFRSISGKSGMGGLGGVGKANAKVYVEKSTGVTFADVAGQEVVE